MQFNKCIFPNSESNNLATAITGNNSLLTFRNERLDDPELFIEGIQGLISINEYSEAKGSFVFRMCMREEAKDWVSSIPMETPYEELVKKFRARFVGRTTCLTYIKRMAKETYTEGSVLNYLDKMKGWARRAGLPRCACGTCIEWITSVAW
jgi:hypothetical protein